MPSKGKVFFEGVNVTHTYPYRYLTPSKNSIETQTVPLKTVKYTSHRNYITLFSLQVVHFYNFMSCLYQKIHYFR